LIFTGYNAVNYTKAVQPAGYPNVAARVARVTTFLLGLGFAMLVIIAVILILMRKNPTLRKVLTQMDLFKAQHSARPKIDSKDKTKTAEVAVIQSTFAGGFFAVMYLIAATLLVGVLTVTFIMDNVIEQRSLMPVALINEDRTTRADFYAYIKLDGYRPECVQPGTLNTCADGITVNWPGFESGTVDDNPGVVESWCTESFAEMMTVDGDKAPQCALEFRCPNCTLSKATSKLNAQFGSYTSTKNAYALAVHYKLQMTSGVPSGDSMIEGTIVPGTSEINGTKVKGSGLFRGIARSGECEAAITPTQYDNNVNSTSGVGYHVSQLGSTPPFTVPAVWFHFENGIQFTFSLNKAPSFLQINLINKQTAPQFLSQVLATFSGLLGVFGILLGYYEMVRILYKKKKFKGEGVDKFGTLGVGGGDDDIELASVVGGAAAGQAVAMDVGSPTPCVTCGVDINPGDNAMWQRGKGIYHSRCEGI